jgi:hypothetical protein
MSLLEEFRQVLKQPFNLAKARRLWWKSQEATCLQNLHWNDITGEVVKPKRSGNTAILSAVFDAKRYQTVLTLVNGHTVENRAMTTKTKTVVTAKERRDEVVSAEVLSKAVARSQAARQTGLQASALRYLAESGALMIVWADQSAVLLPIKNIPELSKLEAAELGDLKLGLAGRALCLDAHDLHVSIAGLLAASPALMSMAKTVVATQNGARVSDAKAASSRENGKKGGRPPSKRVAVAV